MLFITAKDLLGVYQSVLLDPLCNCPNLKYYLSRVLGQWLLTVILASIWVWVIEFCSEANILGSILVHYTRQPVHKPFKICKIFKCQCEAVRTARFLNANMSRPSITITNLPLLASEDLNLNLHTTVGLPLSLMFWHLALESSITFKHPIFVLIYSKQPNIIIIAKLVLVVSVIVCSIHTAYTLNTCHLWKGREGGQAHDCISKWKPPKKGVSGSQPNQIKLKLKPPLPNIPATPSAWSVHCHNQEAQHKHWPNNNLNCPFWWYGKKYHNAPLQA